LHLTRLGRDGRALPAAAAASSPGRAEVSPEEAAWRSRFSDVGRRTGAAAVAADPLVQRLSAAARDVLWALRGVDAAAEGSLLAAEGSRLRALCGSQGGPEPALRAAAAEAAVLVHEGFFFSAAVKCAAIAGAAARVLEEDGGRGGAQGAAHPDPTPVSAPDLRAALTECVARVRRLYTPVSGGGGTAGGSGDPRAWARSALVSALLNAALCCLKREWGRDAAVAACSGALLVLTRGPRTCWRQSRAAAPAPALLLRFLAPRADAAGGQGAVQAGHGAARRRGGRCGGGA